MGIKEKIKIVAIIVFRKILHIFCVFPIDNSKIIFSAFDGTQYADSPKYISEYYDSCSGIKRIWVFDKKMYKEATTPKGIIKVKKGTLLFYFHFFTSKEIVINDFISSVLKLRKKQVLLNTWHGGGSFKTVGFTNPHTTKYDEFFFKIHSIDTSAYVLSSEFFGKAVIKDSFHYYGETLKTGTPRNSILFSNDSGPIKRVSEYYKINDLRDYSIVLYAPTYRSDTIRAKIEDSSVEIDIERCSKIIRRRFGKPVLFIYRAHHIMDSDIIKGDWLNGTEYPDIQDLIYCSDILISDYSSCMWDFAIMKKTVIQYVPDLKEYTKDRNFLLPLKEWGFVVAENNDELERKIEQFNYTKYVNGIERYLAKMQSYENSDATRMVCDWLDNKRKG